MMNSDGTDLSLISEPVQHFPDPQWSPVGDSVAIVQKVDRALDDVPVEDIYLITPNGRPIERITHDPSSVANVIEAIRWSPDSQMIAFATGGRPGAEQSDIYLVSTDGSRLRRLTHPPAWHGTPRWSPDGDHLAYVSVLDEITSLVIVSVSDALLPQHEIPLGIRGEFSWSPNGTRVLYDSEREGNYDIYAYDFLGGTELRLTFDPAVDVEPNWAPDGSRILFRSSRTGKHEIFTMRPDGSGIAREVVNRTDDFLMMPFWAPDGDRFYFLRSNQAEGIYQLWRSELSSACEG
jgi:TolB protein